MEKDIDNSNIVEFIRDTPYPYFHVHELETAYGSIRMTKSATIQFRRGQWIVVPTVIDNSMTENVVALEERGQVYVVECPFRDANDKVVRTQTLGTEPSKGSAPRHHRRCRSLRILAVAPETSLLAEEHCRRLKQCCQKHKVGTSLLKSLQQS